jgi:predicted RNA-binding Zn-ribbon protein involved in translation (DUF1610 family)
MATELAESTTESLEISCQSCGATLRVGANMRSTLCPYCASPSILRRPPSANRPSPTFLVGFVITHEQATQAVKRWIAGSHLFARSDFKAAVPELTRGVYLPAYVYGAVADTRYSASIGENYTEIETYTTTDSKGRTVTRTRTVTKTEWRPIEGKHRTYVVDVLVTASKGVSNEALEAVEPYDLRKLRRYRDAFIAGWLAEEPSRTQDECFRLAHDETIAKVGKTLGQFMPGDSHRGLEYRTQLSNEVIDLVLLPLWSYAVRYAEDRPPIQILVNGQTGRVGGKIPVSATKVTFAAIAVLLLIGLLVSLFVLAQQ